MANEPGITRPLYKKLCHFYDGVFMITRKITFSNFFPLIPTKSLSYLSEISRSGFLFHAHDSKLTSQLAAVWRYLTSERAVNTLTFWLDTESSIVLDDLNYYHPSIVRDYCSRVILRFTMKAKRIRRSKANGVFWRGNFLFEGVKTSGLLYLIHLLFFLGRSVSYSHLNPKFLRSRGDHNR